MQKIHTVTILCALTLLSACAASSTGSFASAAGNRGIQCERFAPTGSRLKTHVDCTPDGAGGPATVRTWSDLEKMRAH
jgi:hypothetical protein